MLEMDDDLPECISLLKDIAEKTREVHKHVTNIIERVNNQHNKSSTLGVDFLDVKCGVLSSYLADLSQVIFLKSTGQTIQNDETIHRLVENRTVLEKMKPIDDRLKYQIGKFVQAAVTGKADDNDPLRLKPNPGNMVSKLGEAGDEDDEDDDQSHDEDHTKAYVPPKLAPAHYEGDLTVEARREMRMDRAKRRALNTGLMRDLQAEYSEAPLEIIEAIDVHRTRAHKTISDKTDFEEDRFVRLPETKKDKHLKRSLESMSSLNSLSHFRDVSSLQSDDKADWSASKKRKTKATKKSSGKKKKKFKH